MLQFQTICFCNVLNSCFIRNVVEQGEKCGTIRNVAAGNLLCTRGRNAPAQALRIFFPATEVQEFVYCIVRLISIAACVQQCLGCCTFAIGLKCNGDTFGIRCIVQVQRNLCVLLFRCYNDLVILLFAICFTVNFHSRCSRILNTRRCGCSGCGCSGYACSSGCLSICYLNNQVAVYISCCNLGVVCASPVKQLTALVVQLVFFENKWEFVVSTIFFVMLQFQTVCFCNVLNSCFIRNVVEQGEECVTIYQVAAGNLLCTGGRNAPAQTLRVFFPATEVQEFVYCIVRLVSIAACIQQCLCCCTFFIGLKCNGDTFGIRCIVQVQRNLCILLFRCYNDIFTLVDCHGRTINNEFCLCCSSS